MNSEKVLNKFNEKWKDTLLFKIAEKVEKKIVMSKGVNEVFDEELKRILCKIADEGALKPLKEELNKVKVKLTSSLGRLTLLYSTAIVSVYENIEEDKQRKSVIENLDILSKI